MKIIKREDIPKWGKKINQLKKRIDRAEISGNYEKVEFRNGFDNRNGKYLY